MTQNLHALGAAARALARRGAVMAVVVALAVGITATLAVDALDGALAPR